MMLLNKQAWRCIAIGEADSLPALVLRGLTSECDNRLSVASHIRSVSGGRLVTVRVDGIDFWSGGSVPVGVGDCNEHPRMADGEDVYLVASDLPASAERGRLFVMAFAGEDFKGTVVGVQHYCGRRPCRGRAAPVRGCWTRCRKDHQELRRAVCRVGRTAERKP